MSRSATSRLSRGAMVAREMDEYSASLGDLWEAEIDQLAATSSVTRCRYVTDGEAVLYDELLGAPSLQRGSLRGARLAIAIPNGAARRGRWMGSSELESGLSFSHGGESIELMLPAGAENRVAIIEWDRFATSLEALAEKRAEEIFPRGTFFAGIPAAKVRNLGRHWGRLVTGTRVREADLGETLAESVAEILGGGVDEAAPRGRWQANARTFRRVIDHLESVEAVTTPGRLALALKISLRSLHNACHQGSGKSPGRLLHLHLMNRVRRELLDGRPGERTVADIATAHGFLELGRFAGQYRQVFGELPSRTLRERTRRPHPLRIGSVAP